MRKTESRLEDMWNSNKWSNHRPVRAPRQQLPPGAGQKKHRNIPVSSAQKDVGLVAYSATSAHCGATKHALASQMRHGKDGSYRRKRSEWHSGRANHV